MIIDPNKKSAPEPPPEYLLKEIERLNKQTAGKDGKWMHLDSVGLVWKPSGPDLMGGVIRELKPPTDTPSPLLSQLVEWGQTLDIDNIPFNSVILIKLNVTDPTHATQMQQAIAQQVLFPRNEKLKEKKACILFMETGDDISIMTEKEMNQAGWEKKDKPLIITPY